MTYKYIYLHMRKRMFRIHLLSKKKKQAVSIMIKCVMRVYI